VDREVRLRISRDYVDGELNTADQLGARYGPVELRYEPLTQRQLAIYIRQLSLGTLTTREEFEVLGQHLRNVALRHEAWSQVLLTLA
jgi:hypothetical protein